MRLKVILFMLTLGLLGGLSACSLILKELELELVLKVLNLVLKMYVFSFIDGGYTDEGFGF